MPRFVTFLILALILAGVTGLGILLNQVDDKFLLLTFALVGYTLVCQLEIGDLKKRVRVLETQWASRQAAEGGSAALPDLGDLKNPTPEHLARALGQPEP